MRETVNYVVCGVDEAGFGWTIPHMYPTVEEANDRADQEAQYETEVWVEKRTMTREIIRSISGPGLPETALIPA